MSWPMQNTGQWNPGIAVPDMNMGSYTADQWTAMQQQSWQQWAQWQQQYAQWQSQYGEKYAEQMQAIQAMGAIPPLPPNSAPPPAPPPPDQPPPPPPHENNQPLYAQSQRPAPVPPPPGAAASAPAPAPGNGQHRSHGGERAEHQTPVDAEALKKLAEEERLFDIQFQKWEEEIEKWKRENVNHPDRKAYREYEAKFEGCRAQLMERRHQMNQKRARLLGHAAPPASAPSPTGNVSTAIPPPLHSRNKNNQVNTAPPTQNYQNNNPTTNYPDQKKPYQQFSNPPPAIQREPNYTDPQERFESYHNMQDYSANDNYVNNLSEGQSFLPSSSGNKGIPGLDLVLEAEKAQKKQENVIDITEEPQQRQFMMAPDYSTISKGINSILGDEKIMNILSMVRDQTASVESEKNNVSMNMNTPYSNAPNMQYGLGPNNRNMPSNARNIPPINHNITPNNSNMAPNNGNMQVNNRNIPPNNHNIPPNNHNIPPNNHNIPPNNHNIPPNNQWDRGSNDYNQQFGNRTLLPNRDQMYQQNVQNQNVGHQNRPYHDENKVDDYYEQDGYFKDGSQYTGAGPPRGPSGRPHVPPPRSSHDRHMAMPDNRDVPISQPPPRQMPKWIEEPLFTPSIIVEYEHKPLRLKAREFIEPVHMFDYNHKSKEGESKKKDFEREVDELFSRKPRRMDSDEAYKSERILKDREPDRFPREYEYSSSDRHNRDWQYERRVPKIDDRDEYRPRVPPRDSYDDRRRQDDRYDERIDDRRRDDRERDRRRDDMYKDRERDRERDSHRDRHRDNRRGDSRNRSRSRDRDTRKRGRSKESDNSELSSSKKSREPDKPNSSKHIVMIDDILEPPGRDMRPQKIVIILRGPPGSGKSYLAKLIRDREAEYGGTARIMSIDDYFMQEGEIEEKDPNTGKIVKKPSLKYEYDPNSEETYLNSLKRAFKRSVTDGFFSFLIYDAPNEHLRCYADVWNFARQNGFQVYVCTMELDANVCFKRNIHNRSLEEIQVVTSRFFATPVHHIQLDATTLLQSASITHVNMEDAVDDVIMEDAQDPEVETVFTSKWERMDDAAQLARLDGTSKPLRPSQLSMEDYLQLDDWTPNTAKPGKKTVRWADIEERRQQEKMRAIGFVVGQTDWNRMTDPTMGSSALTQTKYIERVRRK